MPFTANAAIDGTDILQKNTEMPTREIRAAMEAETIPFLEKAATHTNTATGKNAASPYKSMLYPHDIISSVMDYRPSTLLSFHILSSTEQTSVIIGLWTKEPKK